MAKLDNGPPRGTRDLAPDAVARRDTVISVIASCYERFGFRRIETPAIEDLERLSSGEGGENEKLIYKVLRRGLTDPLEPGTSLSSLTDLGLRYDLTVPLARFYAANEGRLPKPFRSLQIGPVWRAERPQKGRYRQFTQCDIDTIGEPGGLAEIELLEATTSALGELGIEPVTVRLNDRRLLSAVALESGVEAGEEGRYFVTLDKLDKLGWDGVRAELSARGFEPSVGERCEHLVGLLKAAEDPGEMLERAADLLPSLEEGVLEGLRTTARGLEALRAAGSEASFELDPTVVRGMGYYTGQIFEVIHPDSAGSIAGGGRYDKLIARSLGRDVPACGISIGFERVIDLATVRSPDLGLALLHRDDEAADVLTAVARDLRGRERAVTLVPRSASMRAQLEGLATAGYSSFAVLEEGSVSPERDLARKKEPD